ncbi:uncharacterized protein LOC126824659 [Patella vulgata]|uniref:uncharacterized protein LOC126824659 n=1 Tax=Patella vulgata TaxID=6465 RepID=UPI00217F4F92|nr:uncharacterized protein LOC126824659 [Patella vulgata]
MSYFNNPSVPSLQYQYAAQGPLPGAVNYHHTQAQPIIHPTLPASPYHNRLTSYPVDYSHPPTPIPYQYWTRRHTDVASPPNIIPSPPVHNNYIHHSEIKCTGTQQSSSDNNWPMIVQKHESGMVVTATDMFLMKATGHGISITPQQTPSSKQSTPSPQSTKPNAFVTKTLESNDKKDENIIKKIDKLVASDGYCYSQKWTGDNNKPNDAIINKNVTSTLYKSTSSTVVNKNPVVAKPSKTDLFFERAWKLGIECSNPKSLSTEGPKALETAGKYSNREPNNTSEEHLNNDPNVNVKEQNVLDSESDIDSILRQVAKQLTKDVLCSAIIEINLDYGITISIGDLGFDVENEVQIIEQSTKIEDDDREDSNEKLASSLTSSQTSLLNPDTPEFKPISVEIADPGDCFASSYLPFQTIPISPEYHEDEDYNDNNFYASMDCADYVCRNADMIEVRPYTDELVDCETQTAEKCSFEVGVNTINYESKTCAIQTENFKCKTKNRKLQTSPELSFCYNKEIVSDSSYRYMKVLEKEVYSLRSQMCSSELQRELHELHYSKTHWSNFFNPQSKEKTGLEDLFEARMKWLQQCIANLQCQLEEGLIRLDKGGNLKDLPVLSIYIPTSSGNASYLPKSF